jgi:PAS domain-containing protein
LTPTDVNSLAAGTVAEAEVVAILDAAADAMFRLDAAGRVTRCNRSARRILGHGTQELLGQPFRALLLPAGRPAFDALIAQAGHAGRVDDYSRISLRAATARWSRSRSPSRRPGAPAGGRSPAT